MEIFTYHSRYNKSQVRDAIAKHKADGHLDTYGNKTLQKSYQWLIASLDDTMKNSLKSILNNPVSGPEFWMCIVEKVMADSLS